MRGVAERRARENHPRKSAWRLAAGACLTSALLVSGCAKPLAELQGLMVRGTAVGDLLPADREVGSWRLEGTSRRMRSAEFADVFGREAADRARRWGQNQSIEARYRLGATGRTVLVQTHDMIKRQGAFDVYSLLRARAAEGGGRPRLTKVGVQGLFSVGGRADAAGDPALVFWADRFLVRVVERGGTEPESEPTLLAFGQAVAGKAGKPFELPEVYVIQVSGEVADSERYVQRNVLDRQELPSGVTASWRGRTGSGTLFISIFPDDKHARWALDKLRKASGGIETPGYADGLIAGELPSTGPVACFRLRRAVAGIAGSCEPDERMEVLEEIRRRCAGEEITPAVVPGTEGGGGA